MLKWQGLRDWEQSRCTNRDWGACWKQECRTSQWSHAKYDAPVLPDALQKQLLTLRLIVTGGVAFADPTYQDGRFPVDAGTGANNGHNGRVPGTGSKYDFLNANFGPRFRSYCQAGDEFCDTGNGPDAGDIHGRSPGTHASAAIAFLTSLF